MNTKEFVQLIRNHGWNLYKIPNLTAPSFEEMQKNGPVDFLYSGEHSYFFAPKQMGNQTLREAYSITKGLGPSLVIYPKYEGLLEVYKGTSTCEMDNEIFFSRLFFEKESSTLMTPKTTYNFDPSAALLETRLLLDIFKNNFRIVRPGKYGKTIPIPMIQNPRDN
ncbi:MAG: hypothetical protein WC812_01065 [Candidatus Pacearchaeota archaeon]|jgi:hypothetical protein